jgi:small subunit ribosomal protein S3
MSSERKFIRENIRRQLLKEYLHQETLRAGFGGLDVARTPLGTHITLIAERPGMVIGRRGATINRLTEEVNTKFGFDNPQIEVQEADVPALNPHIMVQKLAVALEKGWHFRRAGHSTVMRIMEAGARGCQVEIAGKLTGDRHRRVKFRQGHIKYCGEPKQQWMRISIGRAERKTGTMGLQVMIMGPEARMPDEIELLPPEELTEILEEYAPKKVEGADLAATAADLDELDKMIETDLVGTAGEELEPEGEPKAAPEASGPAAEAAPAAPAEGEKKPKAKSSKPRAPRKPRKKEGDEAAKATAPAPAPAAGASATTDAKATPAPSDAEPAAAPAPAPAPEATAERKEA